MFNEAQKKKKKRNKMVHKFNTKSCAYPTPDLYCKIKKKKRSKSGTEFFVTH